MLGFIRHVSSVFWAQYPVGTRLTWSFVTRQLNLNRIYLFNSALLLIVALIKISRTWPVVALPFLKGFNENVYRKTCPWKSRTAQLAYYFIFCLPTFALTIVIIIIIAIFTIAIITAIALLAATAFIIWLVPVLTSFTLWFVLYRYPVYEVIYPQIRTWILRYNSQVYQPLPASTPQDAAAIRVLRLNPGNAGQELECELITTNLATANFEALSYVWGVTLFPYKIKVNGMHFFITYNLYTALQKLRFQDKERFIWIDAVCMNQFDLPEKSAQVQLMRTIYFKASQVIVWQGKGSKATSAAFQYVRDFNQLESGDQEASWEGLISSRQWRSIRREFSRMLEHDWWTRAWIIQEVVAAHRVLVQRGSHQVEWEALEKVLLYGRFRQAFNRDDLYITTEFADSIQDLRSNTDSDNALSNTLLGLAYRFRYQSATFGSDKIYALLGLLNVDNPTLVTPDYSKTPEDVFLEFTISCLEHNKNLTAVALAAGSELQDVSWCRNWAFSNDGSFPVMWFSTWPPARRHYSASGSHPPMYKADLTRRILSLQGFEVDLIAKVGDFNQQVGVLDVNWDIALLHWEHAAGGPWKDGSVEKRMFNQTITADNWTEEPLDWQSRLRGRHENAPKQNDEDYLHFIDNACINRRFFITESGRFGLGPWNLRKGDLICILLGGKVPFVLRRLHTKDVDAARKLDEHTQGKVYFKVIGEAYCHGSMYYEGDMAEDIKSRKVSLSWYHLL